MQQSTQSGVSKLFLIELDKNTGQQVTNYEWLSDANYGYRPVNNVPTAIVADSYGNFIVGGAVGTRFFLNPTDSSVVIQNYGMKDTDFWLGKFGNKDCNGEAVENPNDTAMSVPVINVSGITIYPNPVVNGELIIENGQLKSGENVQIFDVTGKIIVNYTLSIVNSIDVSALPQGIYIVKIGEMRGKFIKQ
jgi:hypothetical protein